MKARSLRQKLFAMSGGLLMAANALAAPTLWVDDALGNLGRVDVATGAVSIVGNTGVVLFDIAFNPSGDLYGITHTSLYRIDPATAHASFIGSLGTGLNSLVFAADGTLYGASNSLYTISTVTGTATSVGSGGAPYNSSGDLAFVGGNLYLSSNVNVQDELVLLDPDTGIATVVGSIGVGQVLGLATDDNITLYGAAGTSIYQVSTTTGAGTLLISFGGRGLGQAYGTAFVSEASPPQIPEPATSALLAIGMVGMAIYRAASTRRNVRRDAGLPMS